MFRFGSFVRAWLAAVMLAWAAGAAQDPSAASSAAKPRVCVLPFAVENADPALADAFAQRLSECLRAISEAPVVSLRQAQGVLALSGAGPGARRPVDLESCRRNGALLGADIVVCGSLWGRDTRHVLMVRALNVKTGLIDVEITHVAKTPKRMLARAEAVAKALPGAIKPKGKADETEKPEPGPRELLEEAKRLQADKQWRKALTAYKQVRLTSLADEELDKRISECYARLAIEMRHKSEDYARSVETMTRATGLRVLRRLLDKIAVYYVTPADPARLIASAAKQIRMLAESESARERHAALAKPEVRDRLAAAAAAFVSASLEDDGLDAAAMVKEVEGSLLGRGETGLPVGVLLSEVVFGVVAALDRYSVFMPPDSLKELEIQTSGRFCGIGAEVRPRGQLLTIVTPLLGSPAANAGIVPGDRVILIDGEWGPPEITLHQAVKRLRGRWRAPVNLHVVTEGETFPVRRRLVRGLIKVASVRECTVLQGSQGIGYVRLISFREHTPEDMAASLDKLESQNIKALVLDLRGNSGGLLTAAVKVADQFVSEGVIVSTRGRIPASNRKYMAHAKGSHTRYPVAVLLNGQSASASEIVASVIRDHKRGPLVGTKTVGKGSVQAMFKFKDSTGKRTLAGANLTIARYFPPCGKSFDEVGIVPDIVVDLSYSAMRKVRSRKARRWVTKNMPGFESKLSAWRRDREEDAKATDVKIDVQLAMAVQALQQTLKTGSWLPTKRGETAAEPALTQQPHP